MWLLRQLIERKDEIKQQKKRSMLVKLKFESEAEANNTTINDAHLHEIHHNIRPIS